MICSSLRVDFVCLTQSPVHIINAKSRDLIWEVKQDKSQFMPWLFTNFATTFDSTGLDQCLSLAYLDLSSNQIAEVWYIRTTESVGRCYVYMYT